MIPTVTAGDNNTYIYYTFAYGTKIVYISVATRLPTAEAGSNQTVYENTPMNFDGSNSTDKIVSYTWMFTDKK